VLQFKRFRISISTSTSRLCYIGIARYHCIKEKTLEGKKEGKRYVSTVDIRLRNFQYTSDEFYGKCREKEKVPIDGKKNTDGKGKKGQVSSEELS